MMLNTDIDINILLLLNLNDLQHVKQISTYYYKLCVDDNYWGLVLSKYLNNFVFPKSWSTRGYDLHKNINNLHYNDVINWAVENNVPEIVSSLINNVTPSIYSVNIAVARNYNNIIDIIFNYLYNKAPYKNKAGLKYISTFIFTRKNFTSMIHILATINNNQKVLQLLKDYSIDNNYKRLELWNFVIYLAKHGYIDVIQLLSNHIDVELTSYFPQLALNTACRNKHTSIVDFFAKYNMVPTIS